MNINDYNYHLPKERIAQQPTKIRGKSRLLAINKSLNRIEHKLYYDVVDYLRAGDVVVLNNTKVIKARLIGRHNNKTREFLLLERHSPEMDTHHWKVLCRGEVKPGEKYIVGNSDIIVSEVLGDGIATISSADNLLKISNNFGSVPLPPYMNRDATKQDIERYQTEFALTSGSVAAPTASLNFTGQLIRKLQEKRVNVVYLTLHVGLGTFLPIRTNNLKNHKMHSEYFEIPTSTIHAIRDSKKSSNKVLAVGTTVTRTLEYAHNQIINGPLKTIIGEADIFIYPGYKFKTTDYMLTNFHAPKSTVLMMAAAFAGWDNLENAYQEAIKEKYAFLSYGDSMLIT